MDESLMCFDKAKTDSQNASQTAQLAFNISETAKQVRSLFFWRLFDAFALFSLS